MQHRLSLPFWTAIIVVSLLAGAPTTTAQFCELCGCSFCPTGEFPVGNPDAIFPIPEGQLSPDLQDSLEQLEAAGIVLDCGFVAFALALSPPDQCAELEEFRLLPELRELCGCPPLPPTTEASTASPFGFFRGIFQLFMLALMVFLDFIRALF